MPRILNRRRSAGTSLLEIMIGIAILGGVLAVVGRIENRSDHQTTGRTNADSQATFQNLAAQYFLDNRAAYEAAMKDGTDAAVLCRINLQADGTGGLQANSTVKKTCAFDATLLRARSVWPAGASVDEAFGRYVLILRMPYDTATPPKPTGGVEGLFAVMQPGGTLAASGPMTGDLVEELTTSMRTLGGVGGLTPIGNTGPCAAMRSTATYESCGNGWKVNLADFVDAAQLAVFANALPN